MTPHVVVIGGGFAGLSAAIRLIDRGIRVTVLEAKNSLGGRARSFVDPASGETVDNGQHLFLSGYRETLGFLRRLGTARHLLFQDRLKVDFLEPGGQRFTLDCPKLPAPWHLWVGMARMRGLSIGDKARFQQVLSVVRGGGGGEGSHLGSLDHQTVEEWLTRMDQSERVRKLFWNPLVVATLNEDPTQASALGLVQVLRTLLWAPWGESRLGMPTVGLSDLYAEAARQVIEQQGGAVRLNRPIKELEIQDSRVNAVHLADGELIAADAIVAAVPPASLLKMIPSSWVDRDPVLSPLRRFTCSPIVSINLWWDRSVTDALFVGLIGTRVQWLFNKAAFLNREGQRANYVALILSAAHSYMDQSNEALIRMATEDLQNCFPHLKTATLLKAQVVREREATVSLQPGTDRYRPGPKTGLSNLFLAGDWTQTGLPATVESAVLSGRLASEAILKSACGRGKGW